MELAEQQGFFVTTFYVRLLISVLLGATYLLALATDQSAVPSDLQAQLRTLQQSIAANRQNAPTASQQAVPMTNNTQLSQAPSSGVVQGRPVVQNTSTSTTITTGAVPPNPNEVGQQQGVVAGTQTVSDSGGDLRDEAFGKMTSTTLPMSPEQIELLHHIYDNTQRAAGMYPGVPPRPTSSSIAVNLSPGATPPIIRLQAGFVSSLVFVDSTGAPWPIDQISIGNPTAFNVQWDQKSNILLVQAITSYRSGNIAVILKGLNTPVMLELKPGQAAVDTRADIRVPGLGPNAKPEVDDIPGTGSPVLLALLDGIPPPGSRLLKASLCDNCAWLLDNKLYLRVQFDVISPAWITTMSSADGTHVYEMQLSPVVLVSYNGKMLKMTIEGY